MMKLYMRAFSLGILLAATSLMGQTTVTTSGGTTNAVPVFTGSSTVGNSVITQSGGNVGIGTTSAEQHFQVGDGTASETMSLFGSVGTPGSLIFRSNNNFGASLSLASVNAVDLGTVNQLFGGLTFSTANGAAAAERMRIDKSGNVGIGTTTPGAKLEVDGGIMLTSGSGGSVTFADGTVQSTALTGAIKGARTDTSCRTGNTAGDTCAIDITWPGLAFADTNYTVTCTPKVVPGEGGGAANSLEIPDANKTTTGVTVLVVNLSAVDGVSAEVEGLNCMAIHD